MGREKELKEIGERLNSSDALLLINGIGGVGKSTIASYYLHSQKDNYAYYGFFEGWNGFVRELESYFKLKKELGRDSFLNVLRELRGLEGKKLLVIDDVKNNQEAIEQISALKDSGYQILLTSREEIADIDVYTLGVLSLDDAKELFNSIFEIKDEYLLEEIVGYLNCHALFVEMTAKSLKVNTQRTPEKMIKMFRSGKFSKIKANNKESFNDYLKQLFSLDSLDNEDSLLLKKLSLLPSIEISFKFLTKIFRVTDEDEIEDFQDLLNTLRKKGWLSSNGETYKLHQIIKEFIWANHQPTLEEMDKVVLFFANLIKNSDDVQSAVLLKGYLVYFEAIDDVLNRMKIFNRKITVFWDNLGSVYKYNGFYNKALPFYIKVVEIREKILGEEHECTASSYNNLAGLYEDMGKYQKAEPLFLKALKIREKVLGEEHPSTATSYNNLALLYNNMGEYQKAEPLYLKALKIGEKVLGEEHPHTASSYNNLALLYDNMGEYQKAEPLYLKVLKIREKVLGKEHPSTSTSYNNLAGLYNNMGEYQKAEPLYLKALQIWEKVFGEEHPETTKGYNNLALLYKRMGEYQKAEPLYLKALKIREEVLTEVHPDTAISYWSVGAFYYKQGEFEKAYKFVAKAVEVFSKVLPSNHPDLINSKKGLEVIEGRL